MRSKIWMGRMVGGLSFLITLRVVVEAGMVVGVVAGIVAVEVVVDAVEVMT